MRRGRALALAAACAALSAAGPAAAEPPAAEALFQEGVDLSARGELERACQKFEASEDLDMAVGTLLRLADCYERTAKLASAWSRFREAASLARAQAMPEREQIANVRAEALLPKLAHLTLNVAESQPPDLELRIGRSKVPRASWGSAWPIDAGTTLVEASAPGYITFRREVRIPLTPRAELSVSIPALEAEGYDNTSAFAAPSPRVEVVPRERPREAWAMADRGYAARATGVTLAVVGGAGLAASGVFALLAKRRNDTSKNYCPDDERHCTEQGVALRRDATKLADGATLAAIAGGGLLATGLLVYWVAPGPGLERVGFGLTPDPSGAPRLRVQGAF